MISLTLHDAISNLIVSLKDKLCAINEILDGVREGEQR